MATMIAPPLDRKTNEAGTRPMGKGSRRTRPAEAEENLSGARFFLPKSGTNGTSLELGREFQSEGEARVEALKLGVTYYSIQEWRPVAAFRQEPGAKARACQQERIDVMGIGAPWYS